MQRRISTLHLTPEQTRELKPYLDARKRGIGSVFMIVSSSYDHTAGTSVVRAEVAYLEWGDAVKVVNVLRKLFGLNPIRHKSKKQTDEISRDQVA